MGQNRKRMSMFLKGWNFAHRGLHANDRSVPENSLGAFRLARESGYGAELDVQLSRDGQVVVFHDDTLDRVCGVHGAVSSFDYEELHRMKLCDTEETIPLFTDVLKAFFGEDVFSEQYQSCTGPLVVELKTSGKRNEELCRKTLEILKTVNGAYCIESFDPRIVRWFLKNAPEIIRGQLATGKDNYRSFPKPVASILSHCRLTFWNKPDFIAYDVTVTRPKHVLSYTRKRALLIGWTPHDPSFEKDNDSLIFEFYHPNTRY